MDDDKKPRASNVMQILPEPEKPQGLSREAMARVMKAAQRAGGKRMTDEAQTHRPPTGGKSAEHIAGRPLTDNELQHSHASIITCNSRRQGSNRRSARRNNDT